MQVVFVRHTAAQDQAAGLDDISRELTPIGYRGISGVDAAAKERCEAGLYPYEQPGSRALGTAPILRSALGIDSMQTHDWIYLGDDAALAYALDARREESADRRPSTPSERLSEIPHRPIHSLPQGRHGLPGAGGQQLRGARATVASNAAAPGSRTGRRLFTPLTPETDAPAEAERPVFPALTPQRCSTALLAMLRNAGKWRRRF